jgi:hypothetical protein
MLPTPQRAGEANVTTMIANGDNRAPRADSRATRRADEPYDLVIVCLGFVFGVAVTALFIWLALGGQL